MDIEDIEVFVGIDVGKTHHWATALTKGGKKVFDKALPGDEARLRALYEKPAAHGHLLVVVDQPWIAPGLMEAVMTGRITAMGQRKYSLELRERATRMASGGEGRPGPVQGGGAPDRRGAGNPPRGPARSGRAGRDRPGRPAGNHHR